MNESNAPADPGPVDPAPVDRLASGGPVEVVVGIPTFRRPEQLGDLLRSLSTELPARGVAVLVSDNDCGEQAPAVVAAFMRQTGQEARCIATAERGISQSRNALISTACTVWPTWQWLIMLDDDGTVTPGWYAALMNEARRQNADVLGGYPNSPLPDGAGWLARNSLYAGRKRYPTGPVPLLHGMQNVVLGRALVDRLEAPWFRPDLGLSGGEDYAFFRRVRSVSGRMGWCDEAVVDEPTPPERLAPRAVLHRYLSTGMAMAIVDRAFDGARAAWIAALRGFAGSLVRVLLGAVRFDGAAVARQILMIWHYAGRLAGLFGLNARRYAAPAATATQPPSLERPDVR